MEIIFYLFLALSTAALTYILIRNNRVFKFRCMVNELCYQYSVTTHDDGYKKFMDKLPTYGQMFSSFKRLKLESYFTDEEIKELLMIKTIR